jgi:hypothetical protein
MKTKSNKKSDSGLPSRPEQLSGNTQTTAQPPAAPAAPVTAPEQAKPARLHGCARVEATAIILNNYPDLVQTPLNNNIRSGCLSVANYISQGFLHDTVDVDLHTGRQALFVETYDPEVNGQSLPVSDPLDVLA